MINENMKETVERLTNDNALDFGSKEEYLTWRKNWKERFNRTSQIIRKLKNDRKVVHFDPNIKLTKEDEAYIKDHITTYSWDRIESAQAKVRHMICELIAAREIYKKKIA
jgi:hypothetical protein